MSPEEIQSIAFTDFDHWQAFQTEDVLAMDLVQQAAHYSNDAAWHERESDEAYEWRWADA